MTGQVLNDVYQQPDVIRALSVAVKVLERVERSDRRRKELPAHTGKAWDEAEKQQLRNEFDAGKTIAEIAEIHQRTEGGIKSRLNQLGIVLT
jgi:hypothetical protein